MASYFPPAWARTSNAEKGYVNNPQDPGGETNHGITVKVARAHGYAGAMLDLPAGLAEQIAKSEFWDRLRLDEVALVSPAIALEVFDTNFNLPWGKATEFLQRSLNALNRNATDYADVKADGNLGTMTINALAEFVKVRGPDGVVVLLRCLNSLQCAHYLEGREAFVFGWVLKRVAIDSAASARV